MVMVYMNDLELMQVKGGAGCRVQEKDINASFGKFYHAIREFMDGEKNEQ